jgi:hypothetical protein
MGDKSSKTRQRQRILKALRYLRGPRPTKQQLADFLKQMLYEAAYGTSSDHGKGVNITKTNLEEMTMSNNFITPEPRQFGSDGNVVV